MQEASHHERRYTWVFGESDSDAIYQRGHHLLGERESSSIDPTILVDIAVLTHGMVGRGKQGGLGHYGQAWLRSSYG